MRARGWGFLTVSACVLGLSAGTASAAEAPGDGTLSSRLHQLSSPELRTASPSEQAGAVSLLNRGPGSLLRDGRALVVEIRTAGDPRPAVPALRAAGAEIVHVSEDYRTVTASVGEGELRDVASVVQIEHVEEVITPMTGAAPDGGDSDVGAINTCPTGVISEGDTQMKAGAARTQFDVDGTGVDVGVLSDSYNRRADLATTANGDIASGDLPGPGNPCGRTEPVDVLDDSAPDPPTSATVGDEGRAMLQIVHDLAPGAGLKFATAFTGQTAFAANIRALATDGADVIVDDIIYFTEPAYQDGVIANAVTDVAQSGVTYFSMAFNNNGLGLNSYEAPEYRSTTCPAVVAALPGPDDCMDFDPGDGADNMFDINVTAGAFRLSYHWAEAEQAVGSDFDIYVLNTDGTAISFVGDEDSLASQTPVEFASGTIGSAGARQIVIQRFAGSGTPRMKFISNDNGANRIQSTQPVVAPDVQGPTINGHNGTAAAQSVAAVPFNNSNSVEGFSSRGPVTHLFGPVQTVGAAPALTTPEVLAKPDVAATDGGINTFFGPGNRFYGTSAAAPHAAAVGALQLEANPQMDVDRVRADQKVTAVAVGGFGPAAAGAGLIQADGALAAATTPFPTATITSGEGPTADATPAVAFTMTGAGPTARCSLDGGPAQPCTSPFVPAAALPDGPHNLQVTPTDVYAHSGAPAAAGFTVDTTGPATDFDRTPRNKTAKPKAKFAYSSEPGATFECALDRKPFKACTDRFKKKVKPGKHKFRVQATDALGNTGPAESDRWKLKRR